MLNLFNCVALWSIWTFQLFYVAVLLWDYPVRVKALGVQCISSSGSTRWKLFVFLGRQVRKTRQDDWCLNKTPFSQIRPQTLLCQPNSLNPFLSMWHMCLPHSHTRAMYSNTIWLNSCWPLSQAPWWSTWTGQRVYKITSHSRTNFWLSVCTSSLSNLLDLFSRYGCRWILLLLACVVLYIYFF